ncbi:hypothetical protein PHSC3_001644 [Chlamydiales bacterium STE3]|nr:hypothetical protein PHSC3_001644 [Chlamydiales bacterium STE3]
MKKENTIFYHFLHFVSFVLPLSKRLDIPDHLFIWIFLAKEFIKIFNNSNRV